MGAFSLSHVLVVVMLAVLLLCRGRLSRLMGERGEAPGSFSGPLADVVPEAGVDRRAGSPRLAAAAPARDV